MNRFLLSLLVLGSLTSSAWADDPIPLLPRSAELRLGFETIDLPNHETMGMVGASYLLEVLPDAYIGPAAYGAMTGQRGGFYTGGVEAAWRKPMWRRLEAEAGVYVGGGGGGGAAQGGGLMVRPHLDLLWRMNGQRAGISFSKVRFPNGHIESQQFGLVWSVDDGFFYTAADQIGRSGTVARRGGAGMDRLATQLGAYKPLPGVVNSGGVPTQEKIGLVGFRMEQYLHQNWLWGVEAAGAAHGSADGYAEVLGTLAWETPLIGDWLFAGTRLAAGMGGGGKVNAGGGLLTKAGLYTKMQLSKDYYLMLDGGLAYSPDGQFRAKYGLVQLGMNLDKPAFPIGTASPGWVEGWQWSASVQHYHAAQRYSRSPRALEAIGFKIDRQIGAGFYLSGQAHSAMTGEAGGYSVGLIGVGWETPRTAWGMSAGLEGLAGAAGGGGLATRGGAITQPMAFIAQELGRSWRVRAGAGRVKSMKGELDSNVVDLSMTFNFGLVRR